MNEASKFSDTSVITLAKQPPRVFLFLHLELKSLSFLVSLELLMAPVPFHSTMVGCNYQKLQISLVEGSFYLFYVFVF